MKKLGKTIFATGIKVAFIVLFLLFVYTLKSFIVKSEKDPIHFTTNYVKQLIRDQKKQTNAIATRIVVDKDFIQAISDTQNYKIENIIGKILFLFALKDNIWIRIYNKNMKCNYISWKSKLPLGSNSDIKTVFKHKSILDDIKVSPYDIVFKSIAPIFNKNNNFIGVVEVITHFDSVTKTLKNTQNIDSVIVVDKSYTKKLIHPLSNEFIDGYNIANVSKNTQIKNILKKYGINYFIQKPPIYIGDFFDIGYHISVVDIKNSSGKTFGFVISFIKDKNGLKRLEAILYTISILATILFFILVYMLYKSYKQNIDLIKKLDKKVKIETQKNLQLLYKDELTGTFKKEIFDIDRKKSSAKYIILLNIKGFSHINSNYGFEIGDLLLKNVAIEIMKILDKRVYRLNGDEFLFLSNRYKKDIRYLSKHFYNNALDIKNNDIKLRLSFRFGVCENDDDSMVYQKLTIALQEAKKITYTNYILYKEDQNRVKKREDYIRFNNIIYDALFTHNEGKIVPYFQPIIDNKTGQILKYESLARLEYDGKIYSPLYFIDIIKNGGFSYEMTKTMLEKSIKEISKYDNLTISVNITEDDLLTHKLQKDLSNIVSKYNIKPQNVMVEILEGITNEGAKNNLEQIKELKKAGFSIAIDDFGVDYSNFERIAELDIDMIKIDGKYIKAILNDKKSYLIVQTITNFAHKLGLKVTAEFVENEEIYNKVKELGIEYSQGYYLGKPLPYIKESRK